MAWLWPALPVARRAARAAAVASVAAGLAATLSQCGQGDANPSMFRQPPGGGEAGPADGGDGGGDAGNLLGDGSTVDVMGYPDVVPARAATAEGAAGGDGGGADGAGG